MLNKILTFCVVWWWKSSWIVVKIRGVSWRRVSNHCGLNLAGDAPSQTIKQTINEVNKYDETEKKKKKKKRGIELN